MNGESFYLFCFVVGFLLSAVSFLVGAGHVRFLEAPALDAGDRVALLAEIDGLDFTTPPPDTIYYHGESYLLRLLGAAQVTAQGAAPSGACTLWRYHATGGQFLQIEKWPDRVRMLAGASVHVTMLEVRPATLKND